MVFCWEIIRRLGCVDGRCSDHWFNGIRHCWNLTLSADLTGVKVLCRGVDLTDGSSLMGFRSDDGSSDSSLIRGRGVSGCGDSGGVRNSSSSVDSCLGISRSSANVLKK